MKNLKLSKKSVLLILASFSLFIFVWVLLITSTSHSDAQFTNPNLIKVISAKPLNREETLKRNIKFYLNDKAFDTNLNNFGINIEPNASKTDIQFARLLNKELEYSILFDEHKNIQLQNDLITAFKEEVPATISINDDNGIILLG